MHIQTSDSHRLDLGLTAIYLKHTYKTPFLIDSQKILQDFIAKHAHKRNGFTALAKRFLTSSSGFTHQAKKLIALLFKLKNRAIDLAQALNQTRYRGSDCKANRNTQSIQTPIISTYPTK